MYWHNCFIVSTNPSHKCRSSMRRFFFTAVKKIAFVSLLFPATLYVALLTCPVTSYVGNPFPCKEAYPLYKTIQRDHVERTHTYLCTVAPVYRLYQPKETFPVIKTDSAFMLLAQIRQRHETRTKEETARELITKL